MSLLFKILQNGKAVGLLFGAAAGFNVYRIKPIKKSIKIYFLQLIVFALFASFFIMLSNMEYIFRGRHELNEYEMVQAEIIKTYHSRGHYCTTDYALIKFEYDDKERYIRNIRITLNEKEGSIIKVGVKRGKNGLKVIRPYIVISTFPGYLCAIIVGHLFIGIIYIIELKFYNNDEDDKKINDNINENIDSRIGNQVDKDWH